MRPQSPLTTERKGKGKGKGKAKPTLLSPALGALCLLLTTSQNAMALRCTIWIRRLRVVRQARPATNPRCLPKRIASGRWKESSR